MSEFMVWDKKSKKFRECTSISFWSSMDYMYSKRKKTKIGDIKFIWLKAKDIIEDRDYMTRREGHNVLIFKDTEIKDINGKNIYADSSIFEFKNSQLWNKYNGIFFYNKERLCYQIKIIGSSRNNEIIPYDKYCSDIKIIDTIQENKLGLIK